MSQPSEKVAGRWDCSAEAQEILDAVVGRDVEFRLDAADSAVCLGLKNAITPV
jgi:hypothetical protein